METCDICGKVINGDVYVCEVEGAVMHLCSSCAKGKKLVETIPAEPSHSSAARTKGAVPRAPTSKQGNNLEEEGGNLVDNYGSIIRNAREALKLPLKVLAERISEKESTLLRVEEQKTLPTIKLTKKLEKELGIKITEQNVEPSSTSRQGAYKQQKEITLGDAAFEKRKK
ncbi:MAG: multiprotein bridging factor aMBF1 [Candidatus Micrarchaeia archaeon]